VGVWVVGGDLAGFGGGMGGAEDGGENPRGGARAESAGEHYGGVRAGLLLALGRVA
jgi:hypothetical protein